MGVWVCVHVHVLCELQSTYAKGRAVLLIYFPAKGQ